MHAPLHHADARSVLGEWLRRYGSSFLDDPRRVRAVLRDALPETPHAAPLVAAALEDGLHRVLGSGNRTSTGDRDRLIRELAARRGLGHADAAWVVDTLSAVLVAPFEPGAEEASRRRPTSSQRDRPVVPVGLPTRHGEPVPRVLMGVGWLIWLLLPVMTFTNVDESLWGLLLPVTLGVLLFIRAGVVEARTEAQRPADRPVHDAIRRGRVAELEGLPKQWRRHSMGVASLGVLLFLTFFLPYFSISGSSFLFWDTPFVGSVAYVGLPVLLVSALGLVLGLICRAVPPADPRLRPAIVLNLHLPVFGVICLLALGMDVVVHFSSVTFREGVLLGLACLLAWAVLAWRMRRMAT